ncbi:MAG: efflux RND transporter permease subunit [Candidatus Marinimicrobia bacterium]|nr:efflux RND transporter permease subunit [Candidatus Neomarinimicrobiota bacterium]
MQFLMKQNVLIFLLIGLILGFGIWEYTHLPKDAFPDISPVMVPIFAEGHGMAPEEIERLITYPIESSMNGLPGVSLVKSTSAFGMAVIYVYFSDDTDIYFARQLVNQRLNSAMEDLPDLEEDPTLGPISSGLGEVFMYYLTLDEGTAQLEGKEPGAYLREINDWQVKYQLQTVPGVTEILSMGGHVLQYQVKLNPLNMLEYDISIDDVVSAIRDNNRNVGGQFLVVGSEEYLIRGVGLLEELEQIGSIPLKVENSVPITLEHIAEVGYGNETRRGVVSMDGTQEVVAGIVIKLLGQNSSEVIDALKAKLPEVQNALPEGVRLIPYYDQSELVSKATGTVISALFQAGILVNLILLLFLWNVRTTIIVGFSLPISALIGIILMGWQGISANLMSFGGIAIAIGMLGDGSIVVVESIYRKLQSLDTPDNDNRIAAIIDAVNEVRKPIMFSVVIIIMVFLPIFSLQGVEGKLFKPLAITIVFALIGSLIAALVISPVLSGIIIKKTHLKEPRFMSLLRKGYKHLLQVLTEKSWMIIIPAIVLLVISLMMVPRLGTEFVPTLEEGAIQVIITSAPSTSLETMTHLIQRMEKDVVQFDEVEHAITKIGRPEAGSHPHPVNFASMQITLHPEEEWVHENKEALINSLSDRLGEYPGVQLNFTQPIQNLFDELLSGVRTQLAIKIYGENIDTLRHYAEQTGQVVSGISGLVDLGIEQSWGQPQYRITPNRETSKRYGITVNQIMEAIELAVGGEVISQIYKETRRFGIHVRFQEQFRDDVNVLEGILVRRTNGSLIPLREVATVESVLGPVQINREKNQRRWTVNANIRGRDLGTVVSDIRERLSDQIRLPAGYTLEIGGQFENQERAMRRLSFVIPVVLILIFAFLLMALESVKEAALIYISIPLSLIGGILGLYFTGEYLSVPAAVGFIAVFGIAVQNGLVLISTFQRLEREGLSRMEAALHGAEIRLRPVLMTALTTIFGLIPLLLATGIGSEIQRPLAVVVVFGLFSSTVLTLGILPVFYSLMNIKQAK